MTNPWTDANRHIIISTADTWTTGRGWDIDVEGTTSLAMKMGQAWTGHTIMSSGIQNYMPANTWHNVVVTYDGTTVNVYIDTIQVGSFASSYVNTTSSDTTYIGKRGDNTDKWNGNIDEVGMWSRVLTSAEIAQLYNSGPDPSIRFQLRRVPLLQRLPCTRRQWIGSTICVLNFDKHMDNV